MLWVLNERAYAGNLPVDGSRIEDSAKGLLEASSFFRQKGSALAEHSRTTHDGPLVPSRRIQVLPAPGSPSRYLLHCARTGLASASRLPLEEQASVSLRPGLCQRTHL